MKTNYMMTAEDVATELGISKGHAYKLIRQLNEELENSGFIVVAGKVPRAFWEKKFFGYQATVQTAQRGGAYMPAYKDEKLNTWYCQFYYEDWQGNKKKKQKRGFKTKKEALEWERNYKLSANANMGLPMQIWI